jgi:Helix-turn-helix domain
MLTLRPLVLPVNRKNWHFCEITCTLILWRVLCLSRESCGVGNVEHTEKLLGVSEVAEWLGVSPGWVRDHARRKEPRLPVVRLGEVRGKGLLKFRRQDIHRFIESQRVDGSR